MFCNLRFGDFMVRLESLKISTAAVQDTHPFLCLGLIGLN